jgi:Glycosyltransferase family 87
MPLGWRWGVPAFCWCVTEIAVGNIYAFLAAVAVLGMRWPALWAFPILTKVTPGLGPLWFAVRCQWRQLAWAVGGTLAVAGLSLAIKPELWSDWGAFLLSSSGGGPWLTVRLVGAVTLTIVGARLDRAWMLAIAMFLACPVIAGVSALTVLAAIPRLMQPQVQVSTPGPALPSARRLRPAAMRKTT